MLAYICALVNVIRESYILVSFGIIIVMMITPVVNGANFIAIAFWICIVFWITPTAKPEGMLKILEISLSDESTCSYM